MERNPKKKESLECILTEQEINNYAKQLSSENQRKKAIEDDKKASNSKFKAQIDLCDSQIARLSRLISSGKELRDIDCKVYYNTPDPGFKTTVRLDTDERVRIQPMNPNELEDLFINGLGEQDSDDVTVFVFRNHKEAIVVDRDSDDFDSSKESAGWDKVIGPVPDSELVAYELKDDETYRVLKGDSNGNLVYMLQVRTTDSEVAPSSAVAEENQEELSHEDQEQPEEDNS